MELKDYHSNLPFSFSGKNIVYRAYPKVPRKQLDKTLAESASYSKFKQYKKTKTSPIYVMQKRQLFQADLAFFTAPHLIEHNRGMMYLLIIIDCFTKKLWMFAIPDKQCKTVLEKFKNLFSQIDERPRKLQTDKGTEFLCSEIGAFFKANNVLHYITHSDKKCAIAERAIRTIKGLLYKMMEHRNTYNWIDLLDDVRNKYLNSYHRTIKMTPNQAEHPKNQFKLRAYAHKRYVKYKRINNNPKYKVGDKVRLRILYDGYRRGYNQSFKEEYWIISHVETLPLPTPRYYLTDIRGEKMKGDPSFFENELSLFIPTQDTVYKIKNILKERKVRGKLQYFVSWEGWPDNTASWIDADQVKNI